MIPKKIHYIWFGGAELTDLAQHCLASWEKYCPDYEIIRWDETNFDVNMNRYCAQAIEARKWAFASDFARLWALVNHGGIYMDTDVELLQSLDEFLDNEAFSGFENEKNVPTGIMACEAHQPFFEKLLASYENRDFVRADGSLDTTTNVVLISGMCADAGLVLNNTDQTVEGFHFYERDVFCPKDPITGIVNKTDRTVAIHHFDGSWVDPRLREMIEIERTIRSKHPKMSHLVAGGLSVFKYARQTGDWAYAKQVVREIATR